MLEWHLNTPENKPAQIQHCLIVEKIEENKPGEKLYGAIGTVLYIPKGTLVPLALCEYEHEQTRTLEGRLMTIVKPDYWLAQGGFYWELDEGEMYRLPDEHITHWAEMPELPTGYDGNESDYLRNVWDSWPKDASKVQVVKIK